MQKEKTVYVCQSCGCIHKKWMGRCSECGEWNSVIEELDHQIDTKLSLIAANLEFKTLDADIQQIGRINTQNAELNRVLGGGLVSGSAILIGGDPGIGKSTLLLQLVATLSDQNLSCAYITGEESVEQVQLRAQRLGLAKNKVKLLSATNVDNIISLLSQNDEIRLVVIDSIQTMFSPTYNSAPGTVSQVKAISHELVKYGKENNVIVIFVGHVTKEGQLAGPKILEHIVDTVLYFEGDRGLHFRILRAVKNRFGGVNEIGVFEMHEKGLKEVNNPSSLFLSPDDRNISGTTVFAGLEGTRPILVEVQSLIAPSYLPTPRRSVVGWDLNRLSMIIAVLNTRYGINLLNKEVYLNIVGGMKISEPAADLAVICSIISSVANKPLPPQTIIFGEIGLAGEVRKISQAESRINEAVKLGFKRAVVPLGTNTKAIETIEIGHIKQLKDLFMNTTEFN